MVIEIFERIKSNIKIKHTDEDEILSIGNQSINFCWKKRLNLEGKSLQKRKKNTVINENIYISR